MMKRPSQAWVLEILQAPVGQSCDHPAAYAHPHRGGQDSLLRIDDRPHRSVLPKWASGIKATGPASNELREIT